MTLFEDIVKELKNMGREKDAEKWISSFAIKDVEKKILISHLVYGKPYKVISYNEIDLSESNLSRLQKKAIKSAIKYLKSLVIYDLNSK